MLTYKIRTFTSPYRNYIAVIDYAQGESRVYRNVGQASVMRLLRTLLAHKATCPCNAELFSDGWRTTYRA